MSKINLFLYLYAFVICLCLSAKTLSGQPILPPDKNITSRMSYYYNTLILHLELMEDGKFRISGSKQPFSSMHWRNIPPYYLTGEYIENPPGQIHFVDSIDREHYFWIPVGYTANRDVNGNPILTPKFSDRQARSFPYSLRFGIMSGNSPEYIVYPDGSVKYQFRYFTPPFPQLIKEYKKVQPGKMYPGTFGKFKHVMQAENGI